MLVLTVTVMVAVGLPVGLTRFLPDNYPACKKGRHSGTVRIGRLTLLDLPRVNTLVEYVLN